jgi:ubiquitin-activating enzyme E1
MIGVGALGCELLKNTAMMGLGCAGGEVHITDDDHVALSNLSRQFLFRRKHVDKPKSVSAAEAVAQMNGELHKHLHVHQTKVMPATENYFTDAFWAKLDFVINALDNNIARQYSDQRCVTFHTPLFESGTLGLQANTVIVRPNYTPSYSQGAVAGEGQGIAMCTLRHFPSLTIHCIEWARQMFDESFVDASSKYMDFRSDPQGWLLKVSKEALEERGTLEQVKKFQALTHSPTFEKCVEVAYREFERRFRDAIKDLTYLYPKVH